MASTRLRDIDSTVIDSVCARVRERLGADEAPHAEEFVRQYYRRRAARGPRASCDPLDVYGAALAHWSFGRDRAARRRRACASSTRRSSSTAGSRSHTVVELVADDMPFLVDSVTMELSRHGAGIHLLVHPVVRVRATATAS